jgi:uncharacterized protein (DUF1501 family)
LGSGAAYPDSALAEALRLVARLIKGRFGTRVYYTRHTNNGYDTHHAQLAPHAALLAEQGGALRAFLDDLRAARQEERVAVLVFSEFGRRVQENGSHGTDHGTAAPVFVAGAGARGARRRHPEPPRPRGRRPEAGHRLPARLRDRPG